MKFLSDVYNWFAEQVVLYTMVYPAMCEQVRLEEAGRRLAIIEKAKKRATKEVKP